MQHNCLEWPGGFRCGQLHTPANRAEGTNKVDPIQDVHICRIGQRSLHFKNKGGQTRSGGIVWVLQ